MLISHTAAQGSVALSTAMSYDEGGSDLPRVSNLCIDVGGAVRNHHLHGFTKIILSHKLSVVMRQVIFDYRLYHRGLANASRDGVSRPVLYLTFARSWFTDHENFPSTSLFDTDQP